MLQQVASGFEQMRAEDELPRVYVSLGSACHMLDRGEEAMAWWTEAVNAARRVGDVRMEAYGLAYSAAYWIAAQDFRRAQTALRRAGLLFDDLGERTGIAAVELNTAQLESLRGRWSEAGAHFDRALAVARETANRYQEGWILFNLGQMEKRRGRSDPARTLITEAGRIFTQLGSEIRARRCEEELRGLTG